MYRRRTDWLLAGVTLTAFVLRVYRLGDQSLWYDEGFSVHLAGQSLAAITAGELNPPLYHYFLHLWLPLAGSTEYAVRFLSVVTGLLAVPLIASLGRWLFGTRAGLFAAVLVAVSPFHVRYSQEARMYALAATLGLLSSAFLVRGLALNRRGDWMGYCLASLAAVYTHYYAFLVLAAQATFVGIWAVVGGLRRTADSRPRPANSGVLGFVSQPRAAVNGLRSALPGRGVLSAVPRSWLVCMAALALAYLPWVPFLLDHYRQQTMSYWPSVLSLEFVAGRTLRAFTAASFAGDPAAYFVGAAYLGLILVGCWPRQDSTDWGERRSSGENWLLRALYLALLVVVPVLLVFLLTHDRPKFTPRYLLIAWPPFVLLAAHGLDVLLEGSGRLLGHRPADGRGARRRGLVRGAGYLLAGAALVAILGSAARGVWALYDDPSYAKDDFRAVGQYLDANAGDDEMILLLSGHFYPVFTYYYPRENWYPVPSQFAPSPSVEDILNVDVIPELNRALAGRKGVWLVLWQNEVVDPNSIVTTLLDWTFDDKPVRTKFHGVQVKHYRIPEGVTLPERFDFGSVAGFDVGGDVRLEGHALLSEEVRAGDSIDLLLNWHALRATDQIYKLSLRLRGQDGLDWAQTDARLAGFWYPTNRWKPGEMVSGRHLLKIPPDTPPGVYHLELIAYRASDGRFVNRVDLGPVPVEAYGRALDPAKVEIQHRLAPGPGELSLVGFELDRNSTGPGGTIDLSLVWQATGRPQTDYQVRVELGETSVFQLNENYPTSRWPVGTVLRSRHRLFVPAATRPGEVELRVGLLDAGGAPAGMPVSLAFVRVAGQVRQFELPAAAQYSRRASFGDWALLLGYDLRPESTQDCTMDVGASEQPRVPTLSVQQADAKRCVLHLTLYWQALAEVGASYTVFTHLLDPENRVYAQHDGLPGGGEWPTTGWVPGQVIADRHELVLEPGTRPGAYGVEVGVYDAKSGMRVPVVDEQGRREPDDRLVLAILEMK